LPVNPKVNNFLDTIPYFKSVGGSISQIQMRLRDDGVNNDLSSTFLGTATAGSSLTVTMNGFYEID
jgi:hypothetical protein